MQRILNTFLFLFIGTALSAQMNYKRPHNQLLDQAKAYLAAEDYAEAAKLYKRLLPVDTAFVEVYYEYGLCLVNLPTQRDKALPYLERAVRGGHTEAYYELAMARHRQQRFEEAAELFTRYKQLNYRVVKDAEVDRRIAMAITAKELVKAPVDVTIRNMGAMVNSAAHDYCPLVTADGNTMYFTSRREGTTGRIKDPTGQWLEDIYVAKRIDDVWSNAVNAGAPLNTNTHDATVGLDPDGSSMIVYHTSADLVSGDLYETRMHAGKWQVPELMTARINSKDHEPSASIAPGGDEIYFTSDRPGGFGGRDLYRIRRLPNGEWSLPLNLGPKVNTVYDEDAPFMHSDGITLFFSSKGHNTMGGYDIFKTTLVDADMNGWTLPENMGYPLNTVNDDIYFCLSEDGYTGYFSSERPGGLGMQDIYQVVFPGSQLNYMVVRGVVADASDEPVKARILLTDDTGEEVVGVYNSNEKTGRYLLVLTPGERYHMTVEAQGFLVQQSELLAKANDLDGRELGMDILMQRDPATARVNAHE
ncbi:MAG: PD40 domain-containing protein [Flavobacteriales bacterium]|nr:PD40 domain-containing protein [Flavobacteriales bacterium]